MVNSKLYISEVINYACEIFSRAGIDTPRTDALELLDFVTGYDKKFYLSNPKAVLTEEQAVKFHALVSDRARRIPLQHITGRSFFYGREFKVNGNVLVPRFDTEILVEEALKVIRPTDRVLDICTGSGCIIIALDIGADNRCKEYNFARGVATDISAAALDVAKKNAELYDIDNITFSQGDLFEGVEGSFDVIASNPPYIASREINELEPEVACFDPIEALDGGEDGLVFYRRIIKRAPCYLKSGGYLFLEIGYEQGDSVCQILKTLNFKDIHVVKDYGGKERVVICRKI